MTKLKYLTFANMGYTGKHEVGNKPVEHDNSYKGKHEEKWYEVTVMVSPVGPHDRLKFTVKGIEAAKKLVVNAWDYDIIRLNDGKPMLI